MPMHHFNGTRLQSERNGGGLVVEDYFQTLSQVIPRLPYSIINLAVAAILRAFEEGRTVFVFGNGGSASTASHIACDLNKGTCENGQSRRLKVMSLTDNVPL